jgi:hypothetical protein
MPCGDDLRMGMAVDMLFNSLTVKPHLKGEKHIQFDSIQQPRATFTSAWESSLGGIKEGATFTTGAMKVTVTSCPTQQRWFGLFLRGAENRMGYVSQRNQPLGVGVVARILELVKGELEEQDDWVAAEYYKFGAAAALAVCRSLQGPESFMLNLAGLWKYIEMGKHGIMPDEPLKAGTDLSRVVHVISTLIGEFKGELGMRHHLLALASVTSSGIKLHWWLECLMNIREKEGCKTGPAFGHKDGSVGLTSEYDNILHYFLRILQKEESDMISPTDDIEVNYSFSRTFRRTAEGRARAA